MGRRSDHSRDEIRDMAISAASKIVEKEGFQSLTARKVASEIGYTVGTLYHVFRNFDDLVIHVNARTIDEIAALIEQKTRTRRDPEARIRVMAEYYVQFATNHPDRWRLVFEHEAPPGLPTPVQMKERRDVLFEMVADNLRKLAPELTYWIDGNPVTGEVLKKEEARNLYQQEKAAGRETALAEKDEYRTFDISVYPVRANSDVRVRLVYVQSASVDTGFPSIQYVNSATAACEGTGKL